MLETEESGRRRSIGRSQCQNRRGGVLEMLDYTLEKYDGYGWIH